MLVFVLGQFIYWTDPLSLLHCFLIVEMHPKPSPSGLGFSKSEYNQHVWWTLIYFSLLLNRKKKEYLCFSWRRIVSLCFRLQAEPLLYTGSTPFLFPLGEPLGLEAWEDVSLFPK